MDDVLPFPLLALVGQPELKTALVLNLINPRIGGVLLIGPYGVGKTTAVRGLLDVLPHLTYDDYDNEGNLHTCNHPMRLVELPLNARLEDVVGSINERMALEQNRVLLEEGILARAHRNLLYVDEINLLDAQVSDAILDAAAQGRTMVRRGAMVRLFPSQFVLIGSMNPEEGNLRPQIMDRFGLRVWVAPLAETRQRLEVYRRARDFRGDPSLFRLAYARQTEALRDEIEVAREILPHTVIPPQVETLALALIQQLQVPSHRAEIALLEAARARAAADFRNEVQMEDIERLAVLALRQRRSTVLESYAAQIEQEHSLVQTTLQQLTAEAHIDSPQPPVRDDDTQRHSSMRDLEQSGEQAADGSDETPPNTKEAAQ